MRGPTEEQRAEARRAYESGESMNAIAERMKLRRQTLMAISEREKWTAQRTAQKTEQLDRRVRKETTGEVIQLFKNRAVEHVEESGAIERHADVIAETVALHGPLAKRVLEYADQMLGKAMSGSLESGFKESEAEQFMNVVSAIGKAVSVSREISGLKAGQISAIGDANKKRPSILKLVIVDAPPDEMKQAS